MADVQNLSLGDAANRFLAGLPPEERKLTQPEIYKFIRWFGGEHPLAGLTAAEVANYAERLSSSDTDSSRKLELIRTFLVYAKKNGWSKTNLAVHLKTKRGKTSLPSSLRRGLPKTNPAIHLKAKKGKNNLPSSSRRGLPETVFLTQQGYTELETELTILQVKRIEAIAEISKAAADKDFRENAPLHAAREQRGHLEGRIMELEATLKVAVVIEEKREATFRIGIGDSVSLSDLESGEELHYMLVSPREVNPTRGKISSISPIGQAIIGKEEGTIVVVAAPAGKLRYQIKKIER